MFHSQDSNKVDPLIQESYHKIIEIVKECKSKFTTMFFIPHNKHILKSIETKIEGVENVNQIDRQRLKKLKLKKLPPYHCLLTQNDFSGLRDIYELKFQYHVNYDRFKDLIENVSPNSIFTVSFSDEYNFDKMMKPEILSSLFNLNILEFKYERLISNKKLLKALIEGIESNTKIRDLELVLPNNNSVFNVLKALEHNYMICTVRVFSKHQISNEMLKYMKLFRAQRVGVEISLNTPRKLFRSIEDKSTEMYYPD